VEVSGEGDGHKGSSEGSRYKEVARVMSTEKRRRRRAPVVRGI